MYFSHKHSHLEPPNDDLCLVCLENNAFAPLIHFKELYQYPTKCKCNGIYHLHCVKIWISIYQSCPICRSPINKMVQIDNGDYVLNVMRILLIVSCYAFPIYITSIFVNHILLQLS